MGFPQRMDSAVTDVSSLPHDRQRWARSRWLYYEGPIRSYLKGLGCPDEDVDDLVHDLLIRFETYIVLHYDPARPFRPYLKKAIRSFYFNHLQARRQAERGGGPALLAADRGDPVELLNAGLMAYARKVYGCFASAADQRLQIGIKMLASMVIDGRRQEDLASEWGITERQVRNHFTRAADALTSWMERLIHRDDLEHLAAMAGRLGVKIDLQISSIRGLFSYLSREKRTRALLALTLIYRSQHPEEEQPPAPTTESARMLAAVCAAD